MIQSSTMKQRITRQGVIMGFMGSGGSGIGVLLIEDSETGQMEMVPCENGPTVRALESVFGDVIGAGHTVRANGGYVGQQIEWDYDDLGQVLGWFRAVG